MIEPNGLANDYDKFVHRIYVLGDLLRAWQDSDATQRAAWANTLAGVAWICGMAIATEQHACRLNKSGKELIDQAYCGLLEAWGIDEECYTIQNVWDKVGASYE